MLPTVCCFAGITAGHYVVGAALWTLWMGDKQLDEDKDEDTLRLMPVPIEVDAVGERHL